MAEVRHDGEAYVPEQLASIEDELANLKEAFDGKIYEPVLSGAPVLLSRVRALKDLAQFQKSEIAEIFNVEWSRLSAVMPSAFEDTARHIETLKRAEKLPRGVSGEVLSRAPAKLKAAIEMWSLASTARASGDVEEARIQMNLAELELQVLRDGLGMSDPFDGAAGDE